VLSAPSCPCSSPHSSFQHPLPGRAAAAADDVGISGEYTGDDQHTLANKAAADAAAAKAALLAAAEKERAEAEVKRIHAAKQLARATCTPPPPPPTHPPNVASALQHFLGFNLRHISSTR
jgi:hypothetical protein